MRPVSCLPGISACPVTRIDGQISGIICLEIRYSKPYIAHVAGKGTWHTLRVIEVLALHLAQVTYGLPLSRVAEVSLRVHIHMVPELAPPLVGFVPYRGTPVPVVDMRRRLGYPGRPPALSDHFVFAHASRLLVALVVDRVLGLVSIDPDAIRQAPCSAVHVAGIIPMADGLMFIADLDAALTLEEERAVHDWMRSDSHRS